MGLICAFTVPPVEIMAIEHHRRIFQPEITMGEFSPAGDVQKITVLGNRKSLLFSAHDGIYVHLDGIYVHVGR